MNATTRVVLLSACAALAACGRFVSSETSSATDLPEKRIQSDANFNGVDDTFEIASGNTPDVNANGIPDTAESWNQLPYGIPGVVFFGDSLSDIGNMYELYGVPASAPYYKGRYSNGPVWTEHLASFIGLGPMQVRNYAYGGATTGYGNASVPGAPGLLSEVELYQADVAVNGPPDPRDLFVLWIGPNDFATATSLSASVSTAMLNIDHAITALAGVGARRFLVLNSPDLAKTPHVRDQGDASLSEKARIASIAFNANLAWMLAQLETQLSVDIVHQDFFSQFEAIAAQPKAFGFSNATNRCLVNATSQACANPDQHVFWDGLHPTTAAHRMIAVQATTALLSGGVQLPQPGGQMPNASVVLTSPIHGAFAGSDTVTVTGTVYAPTQLTTSLLVNGVPAQANANGNFSVDVNLQPGELQQPIVATLMAGTEVVDRDRVVVFRGDSVGTGENVANAVDATLTAKGIEDVEDILIHQLVTDGTLNIAQHLANVNPLAHQYTGTFQYDVQSRGAGYAWSTIELVPQSDRIHVRVNLHDVFVDFHAHAWVHGAWDPGFDCDGHVTLGMFSLFTELRILPSSQPGHDGEVRVTQLLPIDFEMTGYQDHLDFSPSASLVLHVASMFQDIHFNLETRLREEIARVLDRVNQIGPAGPEARVLPQMLAQALGKISVSNALGGALGVPVGGNIESITTSPERVSVTGYMAIGTPNPSAPRTVAVPHGVAPHTSLVPITGQPFDFAVSVSLTTLNQLLLAQSGTLVHPLVINQLDLGAGPVNLTAGTLAVLIPALQVLDPSTPLQLRMRATLAPRLLGQPTGIAVNQIGQLSIPQLLVELVPPGMGSQASLVTMSLDVTGSLELGFDAADASLTASVLNGTATVTLVDNQLGAQETSLVQLIETLVPRFVANIGTAKFSLPEISGASVEVAQIVAESGFASVYFRATTPWGQPDLQVTSINAPPEIDPSYGFQVPFSITNRGSLGSFGGGFNVRAFLSLDGNMDPTDLPLAAMFVPAGLAVGETFQGQLSINPLVNIPIANQTLFVYADCPDVPGGSGQIWERDERNNVSGVGILTTSPDAYVSWVHAPASFVGLVPGEQTYRVRVGRNGVGVDLLHVQVTVAIGSPTITWNTINVDVPRSQEIEVDVSVWNPQVIGPPFFGVGGQVYDFPMSARVFACDSAGVPLLNGDSNPGNDSGSTTVSVVAPYWDLAYSISGPNATPWCSTLGWMVTVQNVGNAWSQSVCSLTALSASPYAGQFGGPTFPAVHFWVPPLAPGAYWTFPVSNYQICNAWPGTQYLKVEVEYSAGCSDVYNTNGNNFAVQPIQIY